MTGGKPTARSAAHDHVVRLARALDRWTPASLPGRMACALFWFGVTLSYGLGGRALLDAAQTVPDEAFQMAPTWLPYLLATGATLAFMRRAGAVRIDGAERRADPHKVTAVPFLLLALVPVYVALRQGGVDAGAAIVGLCVATGVLANEIGRSQVRIAHQRRPTTPTSDTTSINFGEPA